MLYHFVAQTQRGTASLCRNHLADLSISRALSLVLSPHNRPTFSAQCITMSSDNQYQKTLFDYGFTEQPPIPTKIKPRDHTPPHDDTLSAVFSDPGLPTPLQTDCFWHPKTDRLNIDLADAIVTVLCKYDTAVAEDFVNPSIPCVEFMTSNTAKKYYLWINREWQRVQIQCEIRGERIFHQYGTDAMLKNWVARSGGIVGWMSMSRVASIILGNESWSKESGEIRVEYPHGRERVSRGCDLVQG